MAVLLSNNATGRLGGSINATQTTISLMSGDGAKYPSPTPGDWFPLTVVNAAGDLEIMRCTARSGDTLTVLRGQEGTIGLAFGVGSRAELRLTKSVFDDINAVTVKKLANLSDLANVATARTNLGLGTAATRNVGTASGNVMQVGAFGLGRLGVPFKTIDKSTVLATNTGFLAGPGAGAVGWANGYGQAVMFKRKNNHATIIEGSVDKLWFQNMHSGVLSGWKEVINTGNILTTTGQSTKYPMTQKAVTDAINNSAIGVGQTWQDVTGSRAAGTTYTNTTGKPIMVSIYVGVGSNRDGMAAVGSFYIDGVSRGSGGTNNGGFIFHESHIIPAGSTYRKTGRIKRWLELR